MESGETGLGVEGGAVEVVEEAGEEGGEVVLDEVGGEGGELFVGDGGLVAIFVGEPKGGGGGSGGDAVGLAEKVVSFVELELA